MSVALVLQAQSDAPPGRLARWAARRGIALDVHDVTADRPLPCPGRHDLAVALGSDASLAGRPSGWALRLVDWLRDAERIGMPVLGICFGAQALAVAHGGSVERLPAPEIGLVTVESADARLVPTGPWVTWHEDVVTLPPLAYELARNAVGPQAFSVGHALGVQFHPEADAAILAGWLDADGGRQLARSGVDGTTLTARAEALDHALGQDADALFDRFAASSVEPRRVA